VKKLAYQEFACFYDELNGAADYDALFAYIHGELEAHEVREGILADLGCGTGELTLRLFEAGYEVIGIDQSQEMLSVLREKAEAAGAGAQLLLLQQNLLELDLYGTIRAAVSTFDTLNHIGPEENFERAIERAAFFMEKGGVFLFDLNTPYKNDEILSGHQFEIETPDALCQWENRADTANHAVQLHLSIRDKLDGEIYQEQFLEYSYGMEFVTKCLQKYGFQVAKIADGENFGPVQANSQRWIFTCVKEYTQEGGN
jgi:SAM-dependent methyltransferase